jgi:hypothetical protein
VAELATRRRRAAEFPGVGKPWREVLGWIEKMPELHGKVWEDVRAARLNQFRYIVYSTVLADRVEVLARDKILWFV